MSSKNSLTVVLGKSTAEQEKVTIGHKSDVLAVKLIAPSTNQGTSILNHSLVTHLHWPGLTTKKTTANIIICNESQKGCIHKSLFYTGHVTICS